MAILNWRDYPVVDSADLPPADRNKESVFIVRDLGMTALISDGTNYVPLRSANELVYTWATKPPAAGNEGMEIRVDDFGGSLWKVIGGRWLPKSGFRPRVIYVDDFKRADTALGSIGGGWTLTGNGVAQARVSGGKYLLPQTDPVNVRTVYACRIPTFSPTYLAVKFNWQSNGGTSGIRKTLALLMCKTTTIGTVLESVHVTLATQVATQVLSAGGAFIDIASLYTPPSGAIAPDGTTHLLEVYVFGSLVISVIDGIVAGYADAPADVLPVIPCQQIIVEHYSPSGQDIQYELEVNAVTAGYSW